MVRDAQGSSAIGCRVLVGLEVQLCRGLQSNSVTESPANPTGVRECGCALAALSFSFCGLFLLIFDFFAFVV